MTHPMALLATSTSASGNALHSISPRRTGHGLPPSFILWPNVIDPPNAVMT